MNPSHKKLATTILIAVAIGVLGFFVLAWLLGPFFSGNWEVPQSLGFGKFRIQFYGLIIGLAALAGYLLAMRRRKEFGVSQESADMLIFLAIISGFIGARLYHVISEFGYYAHNLGQIFAVWKGGLGIFGAAIGAIAAVLIYKKYFMTEQVSFLNLLDWLVPSLVIGQIIGRFGNFVNYELYGYPTNLLWKMFVPVQFRVPPYELNQFFHPLFLYEAAGSLIILVLILKLKVRAGGLFLMWLFLYNVMRFFLEFLRVSSVTYGGIRVNAIVSAVLALLAVALWYKIRNRSNYELPNPSNN